MTGRTIRVSGPSVSILGLLGVAFVVLKLTDVIDWSWWWVLAPFWVPAAFVLVLFGLAFGAIVMVGSLGGSKR